MAKYIYHDKTYLERDLFSSYRRNKKCIRIVFRKDLYGDVRFTVALRKLTKNNEKLKKLDFFFVNIFFFVKKWNDGNVLKCILPKFERCTSSFSGVNDHSKFQTIVQTCVWMPKKFCKRLQTFAKFLQRPVVVGPGKLKYKQRIIKI